LSRLDAGGVNVRPRPLNLTSVLGEIASEAIPPGASVEFDVPDDLMIVADRLVLDRVLSNLLTNAVRYGADPITLSAEANGTQLRITVEDCGKGVAEDLRPRLFERFSRTDSANVGSGLGLAIARAYARAHGGDVVHDPAASGARFTLILPHSPSPDQQMRVSKPERTS
jgi:two-component system sensor histidine kinase MtrB